MKKRYQCCTEKAKEYLESVKDFDELVSPQSLFLHFLGLELSTKVWNNLEVVRKSTCFCFLLLSPFLFIIYYFYFFLYFCLVLSRMTTRFSKQKLVEAQEKKAKGGTVSGLLSKKKACNISK